MTALKVGWFLGFRELRRASLWTTILIVAVMTLTFLNLVVVSGILVGLIQGSVDANREGYSGDVIVSTLTTKTYIEGSDDIIAYTRSIPGVKAVSGRYTTGASVEADFKTKLRANDVPNRGAGLIAGIDPVAEDELTGLSNRIIEGEYLTREDTDAVVLGANLLYRYTPIDSPGFQILKGAEIGDRLRLKVGAVEKEVTFKGVVRSKVNDVDLRIFMNEVELRQLIGRSDRNVDEIAIKVDPGTDPVTVKNLLVRAGFGEQGRILTFEEAQPKFLKDIIDTFALLGNLIGAVGLVVAAITIFIVIFVNAITRRKFIGIMKGIGITSSSISWAYMFQAFFYALAGTALGTLIVFAVLKPYIAANPIQFPFSDGILVATVSGTAIRAAILFIATMIAGFVPAKIVLRQNTLDAILGR